MKRLLIATIVLMTSAIMLTGCQRSVEVQTGARVSCVYGHEISDDVKTVKVPAKTASAYRVRSETTTCELHQRIEKLYAEAQAAIEAGDLETAKAKLEEVVKGDATFRRASEQLTEIAEGTKPTPDTATGTPSTGGGTPSGDATPGAGAPAANEPLPGEGDTSGPTGAMEKYTPEDLEGWVARRPAVDPLVISRDYTPESSSSKALLLVIQAEQYRTADEAKAALEKQMRVVTSKSASEQRIGSRTVSLGDDGRGSSFAGYTAGSILVVMEMVAKQGADPSVLKSSVVDVVKALP